MVVSYLSEWFRGDIGSLWGGFLVPSVMARGMNPRAEGAFEAISYIREFVKKYGTRDRFRVMLESELDNLIDDVSSGTAVDFRFRLRNPA